MLKQVSPQNFDKADFSLERYEQSYFYVHSPKFYPELYSLNLSPMVIVGYSQWWLCSPFNNYTDKKPSQDPFKTRKQLLENMYTFVENNLAFLYYDTFKHVDYKQIKALLKTPNKNMLKDTEVTLLSKEDFFLKSVFEQKCWWLMFVNSEIDLTKFLNDIVYI